MVKNIFREVIMSILDEFFNTKITDSKSKINYKPQHFGTKVATNTGSALVNGSKSLFKNTANMAKYIYQCNILWCKSFYKSDIYYKCQNEICKQIYNCVGEPLGKIPTLIELSFANDYWFGDIQKKYTQQQLKRIEQEFDDDKTSEELCYEMLAFCWSKICPKESPEYILLEADVFKIKNKAKGEENGK